MRTGHKRRTIINYYDGPPQGTTFCILVELACEHIVTQSNDFGIWPPYEAFYIHSMLFSTTSARISVNALHGSLDKLYSGQLKPLERQSEQRSILDGLQNIVTHGAVLSRYFWPSPRNKEARIHSARAIRLRSAFDISEDSPLKNRDLRNEIEHFDEKLDLYLVDGIVGHIIPEYVGPEAPRDGVPVHVFRAYYADVGIFEMLGKRYEIPPIADEISRIHGLLQEFSGNGDRLRARAP